MDQEQIKSMPKTMKKWGTEAQEKAKVIQEKVGQAKEVTMQYVDENPRKATLMAAGIGAAVGALVALIVAGKRR